MLVGIAAFHDVLQSDSETGFTVIDDLLGIDFVVVIWVKLEVIGIEKVGDWNMRHGQDEKCAIGLDINLMC